MIEAQATTQDVHGHPALQHHFENMEQQREAGTLGMWVFLVTEIMFFGGMFLAYTIYRWMYPWAFASASKASTGRFQRRAPVNWLFSRADARRASA